MEKGRVGFAVVYRWRLKPGSEDLFKDAWAEVTRTIRHDHGGLGSRLHRAEDGTWLAYAQWPDRKTWEALQALPAADTQASRTMGECVQERLSPLLLEPVADLLVSVADSGHRGELPMRQSTIVIAAHHSNYPDPVRVLRGQKVGVGDSDPEFPGWIRIIDPTGRSGWAPESILERSGGSEAVATEDYDATELDVAPGDRLTVHRELAGWYWVSNEAGAFGWVPVDAIQQG